MLYLHDKNNLLVGVVPKDLTGGDENLTYISLRVNYHMTGKELLDLALETWNLQNDGHNYHLIAIRPDEEMEVSLELNLKEMGITNGAPLQIVAS